MNKFVKEVIPEIRQILKTQEDDAVRAKFNPEELKKALIDPSRSDREKINLVEMAKKQIKEELDEKAGEVAKGELVKQGEGFTMKEGRTDYPDRAKFELGKYLKENLKLNDNPITASLNYLFNHHREMFTNRRAVYDLIKNVLDDMPEVIEKRADGGYYLARSLKHDKSNSKSKMADLVLDEQEAENYIKHANLRSYSPKMREVMDKKIIADSKDTPLLTHRSESARVLGDNVLSARPGSNELLSASHGSIIPQNSQKVKELPPADLRKAIINAKDDKERLAIIENQKEGIRQRLKEEMTSEVKTANNKEATPLLDQKLIERANENSQFNRGNIIESNLRKTLNSIDDLEISEAKKEMAKKKIIVETQRELKAAADFIPANVSGAAGFNVKKAGKQLDRITKAQEKKAEIIERAGEKNSRFNSFNADIADSEFIKIGNYVTLSGKPKIAVSFRTIPDGSVRLALKKKGFFYDNGISAWSIEPEKFDKSWISGRLSQLFNKDESTLNLKAMTKNDDPFALLPNATATRLRKMRRDASEKDIPDHLINDKSWYDKYVVKYNKDRKTLEKALNIAPIEKFGLIMPSFTTTEVVR